MSLFDEFEKYFKTHDLYQVLGISHDASTVQVRKAYKRSALLYHPDRNRAREDSTKKFQLLSQAYCILADKEKRDVYDQTGSVDEEDFRNKNWKEYFGNIFSRVTPSDIDAYMQRYKGSKEELEDLKNCYLRYKGDMKKISQSFIGYEKSQEKYYRAYLTELINKNEVPNFATFTKSTTEARMKRTVKEAKEAENLSLLDKIKDRSEIRKYRFEKMIRDLEKKYCSNQSDTVNNKGKKRKAVQMKQETSGSKNSLISTIREKRKKEFDELISALEEKYCSEKRTDDLKTGTLVGVDKFGNKYYENKMYFYGRNRWVDYTEAVNLDYDGSQVPAEWHRWLHYITDDPPTVKKPVDYKWLCEHTPNYSGTSKAYIPYSTTKPKIEAWVPPK